MKPDRITLFTAGDAVNSIIARENLLRLLEDAGLEGFEYRTVDVLEEPFAALNAGIFITPALIVEAEGRRTVVYGNLSSRDSLCRILLTKRTEGA